MSNQNEKTTEQVKAVEEQAQKAETPVQAAEEPKVVQQVVVQQVPQTGFKVWLKKHWKGATGAVVGLGTTVGSAWLAYKKGKAAGINSVPMPNNDQEEDYSLNPNN